MEAEGECDCRGFDGPPIKMALVIPPECEMRTIYDLTLPELASLVAGWSEPAYRARQIWQGLYRQFWNSPEQFTNLPSSMRTRLSENLQFQALAPVTTLNSSDGQTVKTLFRLQDGKSIEAVLMRYEKRNTLCISTQAGCAMGCVFCATGQMGFKRHLSSGEIVAQVMYYARLLHGEGASCHQCGGDGHG